MLINWQAAQADAMEAQADAMENAADTLNRIIGALQPLAQGNAQATEYELRREATKRRESVAILRAA